VWFYAGFLNLRRAADETNMLSPTGIPPVVLAMFAPITWFV